VVSSVEAGECFDAAAKGYLSRSRNFPNSGCSASALQRALTRGLGAFLRAAREMNSTAGSPSGLKAVPYAEFSAMFEA